MKDVVIVSAVRTPVGRALKGSLVDTRPEDLAAHVIREAMKRVPQLKGEEVDDVILGCAMPEGEQGMNVARIASLMAGLPNSVPAMTINRFCSSGLQSIALAAERIMCGFVDVMIAGGVESMSMVPMGGNKPSPHPDMMKTKPEVFTPMGNTSEILAEKYGISREEQDAFALASQQKAAKAIEAGKFKDEVVPIKTILKGANNTPKEITFEIDEAGRPDTTLEGLSKLRPVFHMKGKSTAGNSSPVSDGASVVVLMSKEMADQKGIKPLAYFRNFQVAGVDPEIMGIGPAVAIPKLMEKAALKIEDIGVWEINEAFASQSVYCVKELGIDPAKVNVNGGAIALGHPLGATGCILTCKLIYEMIREKHKYGVVSMCIGGGMGAAGLFELA